MVCMGKRSGRVQFQWGGAISLPFYPSSVAEKLESPNKGLEHPDLFALIELTDSEWHGECWMLSMSEHPSFRSPFPNADGVCSLSDILVTGNVPQRYYLTPRACLGILRRASERNKELPPVLKEALEMQSMVGGVCRASRIVPCSNL